MDCPLPTARYDRITLAHGGGGTLTDALIREVFLPAFGSPAASPLDATPLPIDAGPVALTTDSYVVQPLFFPGGDIGTLAVNGTVNDLLMVGARPVALTAGFILEEGLEIEVLRRVVASMRTAAATAQVSIVAGDTKVIERSRGDGIYINTSGLGQIVTPDVPQPARIRTGDVLVLTGDIGRHGMAVMATRHGLDFSPPVESDCAALSGPMLDLFAAGFLPHCARDLTRGGLGGVLCELARAAQLDLAIEESRIPVRPAVQSACDLLGLDPLFVANEGCAVLILAPKDVESALSILSRHPATAPACVIGSAGPAGGAVSARTALGTVRRITPPTGEQLPRIC